MKSKGKGRGEAQVGKKDRRSSCFGREKFNEFCACRDKGAGRLGVVTQWLGDVPARQEEQGPCTQTVIQAESTEVSHAGCELEHN